MSAPRKGQQVNERERYSPRLFNPHLHDGIFAADDEVAGRTWLAGPAYER